jgi:hypothetical protein
VRFTVMTGGMTSLWDEVKGLGFVGLCRGMRGASLGYQAEEVELWSCSGRSPSWTKSLDDLDAPLVLGICCPDCGNRRLTSTPLPSLGGSGSRRTRLAGGYKYCATASSSRSRYRPTMPLPLVTPSA